MTGLLSEARRGFEHAFGYSPEGVWSAPGRVNLIGEHTDYNEGFVLPFAIDRRTFAALAPRNDGLVRVSSGSQDGIAEYVLPSASQGSASRGTVHGWAAYPLGVAWGLGQLDADLAALPGFDVHFVSDVDLRLDASGLSVLVIDTKVNHEHASGGYAARRASCEKAARVLGVRALRDVTVPQLLAARGRLDDETYRRARHVITEDQRVVDTVEALRTAGPSAIGDLMSASHRSMRDDFEISTAELDLAVSVSAECGATGARMTGGGFGGSAIALAPHGVISQLRTEIDSQFSLHDYARPEMFVVRPAQGARRDS